MNLLSLESSPYLLQHAQNPVHWQAWNSETLKKAVGLNKPILLSIGYSACHWCHVMEHESFENEQVAEIMNEHFVCIKVDREERPDVDAVYMDAVQAMGVGGGWPLNVFLLPDTQPFYGGTYFPAQKWANLCFQISEAFKNHEPDLRKSAQGFTKNLQMKEYQKYNFSNKLIFEPFSKKDIEAMVSKITINTDTVWGGQGSAPKFPMPCVVEFLLEYSHKTNDKIVFELVNLTLEKMAFGGIFDQLGGGFSRYSVDNEWFCPHFEKMAYDNGQLIKLYARAYKYSQNPVFKRVVLKSIQWLQADLLAEDGSFYSAQDADSEGEEGKFYVWEETEIENILGEDASQIKSFFQTFPNGNWIEEVAKMNGLDTTTGANILWTNQSIFDFCKIENISAVALENSIEKLLSERRKRIFPSLDDKRITSWNALITSALVESYDVFNDDLYLELAQKNIAFITKTLFKNGKLFRTVKDNQPKINAFLEDYATLILALVKLYQSDFDTNHLSVAETLALTIIENYYDAEEGLFYFCDKTDVQLIANKKEIFDNVIPSSNALTADALYQLGVILGKEDFVLLAEGMLEKMRPIIIQNPEYCAYWANLSSKMSKPRLEIIITGQKALLTVQSLKSDVFYENVYFFSAEKENSLPNFKGKTFSGSQNNFYVCYDKVCQLPVQEIDDALIVINALITQPSN